jgi:hypothetical protein
MPGFVGVSLLAISGFVGASLLAIGMARGLCRPSLAGKLLQKSWRTSCCKTMTSRRMPTSNTNHG